MNYTEASERLERNRVQLEEQRIWLENSRRRGEEIDQIIRGLWRLLGGLCIWLCGVFLIFWWMTS